MARVIVFDVNETLLDLNELAPYFERAFGDAGVLGAWFAQMIESTMVGTITGAYADFGEVARGALELLP